MDYTQDFLPEGSARRKSPLLLPLLITGISVFLAAATAAVLLFIGSMHNDSKTYTVQFVDWNGNVLHVAEYAKGDAIREPAAPERAGDNDYFYTFAGWDAPVSACQGEMTFVATYSATQKQTEWIEEDGSFHLYINGQLVTQSWVQDQQQRWVYLTQDGSILKNGWTKDQSGWHYMDSNGYIATNYWALDGDNWVYLDKNGDVTREEWVKDSIGWCYVDENGYMVRNKKIPDGDTWYDIGPDGYIQKTA